MLPTQSVVKALTAAGYPPDRAPQGLTSLPAMAAQFAKLKQLQSSPQWHLLARHLGPEVNAIQASLAQANGAMTRDAGKAMSLMNAAEKRLHGGTPLSGEQSNALRATAARLQGLQATIQNTYAALRTAGLYEADRHPVATQIATWRASLASRLDAATQRPAAGPAMPPAAMTATAPITAAQIVDRPTAAVDAALRAIGQWGQLARQWVEMPADATPERRKELEGRVMNAGQDLRRALNDSAIKQVMQAGANTRQGDAPARTVGTASASPPPGDRRPDFEEVGQRLLNALLNGIGSVVGDNLQRQFGVPVSPDSMEKGMLLAASLGLVLPPGTQGVIKGSVINGAAGAAETGLRQISGLDPWNPDALLASLAFGAVGNAAIHQMATWMRLPGLRSPDLERVPAPELPSNTPQRHARDIRSANFISITSAKGERISAIRNRLAPDDPQYSKRPVLYISPDSNDRPFEYVWNFDPSQILLRERGGTSGRQVPVTPADWPRIAVFSWHGGIKGFTGLSTADAARHMAQEVVKHNRRVEAPAERIEYVLLASCWQGTRGGILPLWGTTNAKRFADELNAELRRVGAPPVDVLAARDAGPITASVGESRLVSSHVAPDFSADPVVFVTPDQQRGGFDYYTGKHAADRIGAASVAATVLAPPAKYVYDIVKPDSEEGK
jgi:hypothetical protein